MRDYQNRLTHLRAAPRRRLPAPRSVARRGSPPPPPAPGYLSFKTKLWLAVGLGLVVTLIYVRYQVQNHPESPLAKLYMTVKGEVSEKPAAAAVAGTPTATNAAATPAVTNRAPTNTAAARPIPPTREPAGDVSLKYEANFFLTQLDKKSGAAKVLPMKSSFAWGEKSPYGEAVRHLVRLKPDRPGMVNPFPTEVKLTRAWIENGVLLLDFNRAFEYNRYGHLGLQVQLQQVLWTVFDLSDRSGALVPEKIDSVGILIDGKRKKTLGGEGVPLKTFYGREDLLRTLGSRGPEHS